MSFRLPLWVVVGILLSSAGLGQSETLFYLRAGHDLGCQGWGGELGVRQGAISYGPEYYACQATSRASFRLAWQPFPSVPLELGVYGGVLGTLPSWGFLAGGWLPMGSLSLEGTQHVLLVALGFGWTHLPTGHLLPGARFVLAWETRFPVTLPSPSDDKARGIGDSASEAYCVPPTAETLMATFTAMAEATRSAVISSLSALYTDFQAELSDLEVLVEGSQGTIRGRYTVGATHRLTGTRRTYSGQGTVRFRHNGCSWELVSYHY